MIEFLADWFPKQVINDKSIFLTKNWPYVSAGSVPIATGLNCSLGLHIQFGPKYIYSQDSNKEFYPLLF